MRHGTHGDLNFPKSGIPNPPKSGNEKPFDLVMFPSSDSRKVTPVGVNLTRTRRYSALPEKFDGVSPAEKRGEL
jgi:hypothetical protein